MIPLILACCIDSPAWKNPKLEPQPPIACSDVIPNPIKCSAKLIDNEYWQYEGEVVGGSFDFKVVDPEYQRRKTEELNHELERILGPEEPKDDII